MDSTKIIIGIGIAALLFAGGYYFYFADGDEPETIEDVVEETAPDALEASIPAPADVAAMPDDVTLTPEGVGIRVLEPGDGVNFPTLDDDVTIYYTGWTTDGEMFDSSYPRGEPDTFPLGVLIAGWKSGMPHMSKGEKSLLWIPGPLAYDYPGARPDAPKGMLVFEIYLIDFAPSEDSGE
ncbi:MAG: FKBP-type peptidyl-prolyl cis-trans isomerase [Alphaproteobacteria bacterium]